MLSNLSKVTTLLDRGQSWDAIAAPIALHFKS